MGPCTGGFYWRSKDIPEEQHTGGVVEVLGWVIAVACLWFGASSRASRSRSRTQLLPTPTERRHQTDNIRITCYISNTTSRLDKSEKWEIHILIRRRLFHCIDFSGFFIQVVTSPALFFLLITSRKAAKFSNCTSEYLEFCTDIGSKCCNRGVVVPGRCADLPQLALSLTPNLSQSIID